MGTALVFYDQVLGVEHTPVAVVGQEQHKAQPFLLRLPGDVAPHVRLWWWHHPAPKPNLIFTDLFIYNYKILILELL